MIMAMYPNATAHGYMPFVTPAHRRQAAKKTRMDHKEASKAKTGELKTYKVTLRDKHGVTLTYIIQADPNSKTMPILCESMVSLAGPKPKDRFFHSLPNMESPEAKLNALLNEPSSPESRRHVMLAQGKDDLSKFDDCDLSKAGTDNTGKKSIFHSVLSFIRKKTGSKQSSSKPSQQVKSKRKPKPMLPKKRQRKISQMSNLQTIHESPNEDEDNESDSDSFTHDSSDDSLSES